MILLPRDSEYRMAARYPDSLASVDASILCHPWRMTAVDASGNCTVAFGVEIERVRVEGSYFSIVPRSLNVVESGGLCADAQTPETSDADKSRTNFMTGLTAGTIGNGRFLQYQRACP